MCLVTMGKNHGDLKKDAESEWDKRWGREGEENKFSIFFLLWLMKCKARGPRKRRWKWKD